MAKMIMEKNSTRRGFVSPSADRDLENPEGLRTELGWKTKTGLGLLVGVLALRRFPKTAIVGAILAGVYASFRHNKAVGGKNPFQGEGLVKDLLH